MHQQGIHGTSEYDTDSESMTSDGSNPGEDLADLLATKEETSAFDRKQFYPRGSIDGVITPHRVRGKLRSGKRYPTAEAGRAEQEDLDSIVDFITKRSRKVFAISLRTGLSSKSVRQAIAQFRVLRIDDGSLPLIKQAFIHPDSQTWRKPWSGFRVADFCKNQWEFLAPTFDHNHNELSLRSNAILPFTSTSQHVGSGAFGEVYQVTIHPAHWKIGAQNSIAALKKLNRAYVKDQAKMEELEEQWQREVQAHREITKCNHANIIKFMAAITRDYERYLVFEWANGGNLREFWNNHIPHLTRNLVEDVIRQLHGLAGALSEIHSRKYRHGDLKPENILRVKTTAHHHSKIDVGTLKICDMGLTKYHDMATQLRDDTNTRFTTWRYEPPEATEEHKAWPRRYDTWSLGCITLEFIVWMVCGIEQLKDFNKSIVNEFGKQIHYFEPVKTNGGTSFKVHTAVSARMDKLAKRPEFKAKKTALGDLLNIVRTKLLVVGLGTPATGTGKAPQTNADTQNQSRAESRTLKNDLGSIIARGEKDPSYWLKGENSDDLPSLYAPQEGKSELEPPNSLTINRKRSSGSVQDLLTTDSSYYLTPKLTGTVRVQLNETWEFHVDNVFATNIVGKTVKAAHLPKTTTSKDRCAKCQELDFCSPHFSIIDKWKDLEDRSQTCDFCKMRWDICSHLDRKEFPFVRFERDQSMLKLDGRYPPVLAIRRGPEIQNSAASHIQIGRPELPDIASQMHFDLLRQCLSDCTSDHPECRPPKPGPLPTRLMHLGSKDSNALHLCETQPVDALQYVALSHPWGKGPHFCTTLDNLAAHRKKIDFAALPAMFQDAVITTRELGLEYLWIDSICIIQGEGGDFDQEAKRMEDVFSSAFCVLAASSAHGQNDGFLNRQRQHRGCITFENEGVPPLYVSHFMDDFSRDVLESPLSKRGWVLQERALARRTIYFTNNQTYWECGKGVRCETLTKMENKLASFIGDPNFPSKLSSDATTRGVKIRLYEDLYRQYTRLEFTRISDRPIAIAGLEKRLIRDLKAQGGFGVFDDGLSLFKRSLLWKRGREVPLMVKIPSAPSLPVPSWSWMAYDGGIDYLDLPLGGVDWLEDAIKSPWAAGGANTWHTGDGKEFVEMRAWAWRFKPGMVRLAPRREMELVCDTQDEVDWEAKDLMCVVAGMEKRGGTIEQKTHFVLVIKRSRESLGSKEGNIVYERFGVGHIKGKYIDRELSPMAVVIR